MFGTLFFFSPVIFPGASNIADAASVTPLSSYSSLTAAILNSKASASSVSNVSSVSSSNVSRNWAGYTATASGVYSGIGSSWVVPQAKSNVYSADSTWVGIGGMGKPDLIQVGTHAVADGATVNAVNATNSGVNFTYKAWYEILPSVPVTIPVAIKPGDAITVSITMQTPNTWLISFQNITTNKNYQTSVYYASSMSSAEWIQEAPLSSGTNSVVPLDDFGSVAFNNAWAIKDGVKVNIQQLGARAINMLSYANQVLAATSALGDGGSSFSVVRTSANASPVFAFGKVNKKK